jgi:hypothetical protein
MIPWRSDQAYEAGSHQSRRNWRLSEKVPRKASSNSEHCGRILDCSCCYSVDDLTNFGKRTFFRAKQREVFEPTDLLACGDLTS